MAWTLGNQKIKPIIQSSILRGRKIRKKANFTTTDIPTKTDAIRNNIPISIINGTRKMPNISLYITSDARLLGLSVAINMEY
jgi:hypothetical protein